jgi:hypothetical protein
MKASPDLPSWVSATACQNSWIRLIELQGNYNIRNKLEAPRKTRELYVSRLREI